MPLSLLIGFAWLVAGHWPVRHDAEGFPLPAEAWRLGSARFRHPNAVSHLAYAPDGKTVYSLSDGSVYRWDAATGRLLAQAEFGRPGTPHQFGFDRGELLLLTTADRVARLVALDRTTCRPRVVWTAPARDNAVLRLAPGGRWLAEATTEPVPTAKDGLDEVTHTLRLYDVDHLFAERTPVKGAAALGYDFAPDGKAVAAADGGPRLRLLDPATGAAVRELATPDRRPATGCRFATDGKALAAWGGDEQGTWSATWDLSTGRRTGGAGLLALPVVSPDGRLGARWAWPAGWEVLDAPGKVAHRFETLGGPAAFSPDGRTFLAASHSALAPFDFATGRPAAVGPDPFANVHAVQFFPGGKVAGLAGGRVVVWDVASGKELSRGEPFATPRPETRRTVATVLSPDGRLAVGRTLGDDGGDPLVRLFDPASGKELAALAGHGGNPDTFTFSPDGRRLYSRAVRELIVWDVAERRAIWRGQLPDAGGNSLTVSPDGRWLACADGDLGRDPADRAVTCGVWVWETARLDARPRRLIVRGYGTFGLAFTADGRLASVHGGGDAGTHLRVWDVASGRVLAAAQLDRVHAFTSPAWSPDGRTFALACLDRSVRLVEASTCQVRHVFRGHAGWLSEPAFSPDGRWVAVASPEAPVYLWDVRGGLARPGEPPDRAALDRAWADLASADAEAAFRAVRLLAMFPERSVPLLRERLAGAEPMPDARVAELIRQLDSPSFAERERATAALRKVADQMEAELDKAAASAPSEEARRRAEELLAAARKVGPDARRAVRAAEVAEWAGTPAADELLAGWAKGKGRLAAEARAAVARRAGRSR